MNICKLNKDVLYYIVQYLDNTSFEMLCNAYPIIFQKISIYFMNAFFDTTKIFNKFNNWKTKYPYNQCQNCDAIIFTTNHDYFGEMVYTCTRCGEQLCAKCCYTKYGDGIYVLDGCYYLHRECFYEDNNIKFITIKPDDIDGQEYCNKCNKSTYIYYDIDGDTNCNSCFKISHII